MLNEPNRKQVRKAFTLIELLVVIAIIAILAAVLFPVFARARENARRSSCLSNLKQINLGALQYIQDYDGRFPKYAYDADTAPTAAEGGSWTAYTYWYWPNMIYPYVKNQQVFICPSSPKADTRYNYTTAGPSIQHYGANISIIPAIAAQSVAESAVVAPANTYLFLDAGYYTISYAAATDGHGTSYAYVPGICSMFPTAITETYRKDCERGRHFDGANVAFVDGHVKWLKTAAISNEALKTNHGSWIHTNP